MTVANLAARFILELAAIGAVGYWGYQAVAVFPARIAVAVGVIVVFVTFWALVVAPRAANAIDQDVRIVIGSGVLLLAAGALAAAGRPALAVAFGGAVILNTILLFVLGHGMPGTQSRSF